MKFSFFVVLFTVNIFPHFIESHRMLEVRRWTSKINFPRRRRRWWWRWLKVEEEQKNVDKSERLRWRKSNLFLYIFRNVRGIKKLKKIFIITWMNDNHHRHTSYLLSSFIPFFTSLNWFSHSSTKFYSRTSNESRKKKPSISDIKFSSHFLSVESLWQQKISNVFFLRS